MSNLVNTCKIISFTRHITYILPNTRIIPVQIPIICRFKLHPNSRASSIIWSNAFCKARWIRFIISPRIGGAKQNQSHSSNKPPQSINSSMLKNLGATLTLVNIHRHHSVASPSGNGLQKRRYSSSSTNKNTIFSKQKSDIRYYNWISDDDDNSSCSLNNTCLRKNKIRHANFLDASYQ